MNAGAVLGRLTVIERAARVLRSRFLDMVSPQKEGNEQGLNERGFLILKDQKPRGFLSVD